MLVLGFSTATMNGGTLGWGDYVYVLDSATFTMSGGWVEILRAAGSSTVTMKDGTVGQELEASMSSTVTMSGGTVEVLTTASDSSTVTMSGGTVGSLLGRHSSSVTMNGGKVRHGLSASDTSTFTVNGGSVEEWIWASDLSTITVTGTRFAVDGSPVPHGDLSAQTGTLTGRLASGDPIYNTFNQGGGGYTGTITLAPPGYLVVPALSWSGKLLLAAALIGFGLAHRRGPRVA